MVRSFHLPKAQSDLLAWIPLDPDRGLKAGISLREAGDLRLPEKRQGFFRELGIPVKRVFTCRQVHSRRVVRVGDHPPDCSSLEADGLISDREDAVLAVTVADCLPVFLWHRRGALFGLLHSGWRGTGIVAVALQLIRRQYGCPPEEVAVTLGPGIGSCCYEVGLERFEAFRKRFGEEGVRREGSSRFLDLRGANVQLLRRAGVRDIAVVRDCTCCDRSLASFRRDGKGFVHMLAFIGKLPR